MPEPTYFDRVDHHALLRDYPIGDAFLATFKGMSRDALEARQDARFRAVVARGWQIPFYRRHWGAAGIEPGDIGGIADAGRLPAYSKSDLMRSVAQHPPFGDFHGIDTAPGGQPAHVVLHTTSGTTGRPQSSSGCWSRARARARS
jgi:phenylacetate-CoA ligase